MSTIPPNWMASVLGSQGAQERAGATRKKEAADQAERTGSDKFADSLHNVIENSDRDSEVYADAEGLGGQGSPFSEEPEQSEEQEQEENEEEDEESQASEGELDIQA